MHRPVSDGGRSAGAPLQATPTRSCHDSIHLRGQGHACRAPVTPQAPDKPVPITAIFVGNVFLPLILLSEQTVTNLCVLFPVTGVFCNPMLLL